MFHLQRAPTNGKIIPENNKKRIRAVFFVSCHELELEWFTCAPGARIVLGIIFHWRWFNLKPADLKPATTGCRYHKLSDLTCGGLFRICQTGAWDLEINPFTPSGIVLSDKQTSRQSPLTSVSYVF